MNNYYKWINTLTTLIMLTSLALACVFFKEDSASAWIEISTISWLVLAILALILNFRSSVYGLLLASFCVLVVIRITGVNEIHSVNITSAIGFACLVVQFFYTAYQNARYGSQTSDADCYIGNQTSAYQWHLSFIRLYIGFDLIAHASEKLFSGMTPYTEDVKSFTQLGVDEPELFVLFAGLCEFGGAIAIGLGLLTRLGAILTFTYILVATVLGSHFSIGFIWALPGGGWEYPVMWMTFILSFSVLGAGAFSIDQQLKNHYALPVWVKRLMG